MNERVLDGKYKLGGVLSKSERAVVLQATHIELRERVAVKILQREHSDPRFAARLRREARQAAQIRSEHVVRYLDIGHLADGRPYVVMERLVGETLSARIENAPLTPTEAVDVVLETCEALACAHVRGILHRDLRTSNLFCVARPGGTFTVKVLNFGTGRAVEADGGKEDEGMTVAALTLDAPDYKAPEQLSGRRDLDARVDIWSLGVVFYELLTGRHPFKGTALQDTLRRLLAADPAPAPEIPVPVWDVIAGCLKANRDARWGDVADLADALAPLGSEAAAQYPARIRDILTAPPSVVDIDVESDQEREPTVVRDVLALAAGPTPVTLSPAVPVGVPKLTSGPPRGLPRVDDGRTGARSFPWLQAPFAKRIAVRGAPAEPAQAQTAPIVLAIIFGLAVALAAVLLLSRRVAIDVHVGANDRLNPAASSLPSAAAQPAATLVVLPDPPVRAAPSDPPAEPAPSDHPAAPLARADTRPAPARPDTRPAPAPSPPRPRGTEQAPKPPAPAIPDPWGWER